MIKDFHHFKGNQLSRSEEVQLRAIKSLLRSKLPDNQRESSKVWELRHMSGCMQIGRILAQKRRLNLELAEISCFLHDIYVALEGKYNNHALNSSKLAKILLIQSGKFKEKEIGIITSAISNHSDKAGYSKDKYVELVKDADVFDCSLYENSQGYYLLHKPKTTYTHYRRRLISIRKELGLPKSPVFRGE